MLMVASREAPGRALGHHTHNLQSLSTGNEQHSPRQPIITSSAYSHYSAEPAVHSCKDVQQWKKTMFYISMHLLGLHYGFLASGTAGEAPSHKSFVVFNACHRC